MLLKRLLSSSRSLFIVALSLITVTGLGLWLTVEQIEISPALNSTYIAPEEDENEVALAVREDKPVEETVEPTTQEPTATEQPAPASQITTLSCTDCTNAAVDKQHSLPSTYLPSIQATSLAGGGFLTSSTVTGLSQLFSAASDQGISMEIISAYRSYATQGSTFESWVQSEIANGLNRAAAEAQANTYSARAGQSEHQLGTTADIKCVGCASFNATQNQAVYDFIAANAHKYGFVVSYPIGQDALTGYTYEPWHIRWIGVNLATELLNTGYISGNGNYVAKFLRDKGLSQ